MSDTKITDSDQMMSQNRLDQVNDIYERWRLTKDKLAEYAVIVGGLGVIVAIVLIFFYLLYVVLPLFESASAEFISAFDTPGDKNTKTLLISMEEQNEVGVRFTNNGQVVFFNIKTGEVISESSIPVPESVKIESFSEGSPDTGTVIFGLSDGRAVVARHVYKTTYPNNKRVITPLIEYPFGNEPIVIDEKGDALKKTAIRMDTDSTTIVAKTSGEQLFLVHFKKKKSLFDDENLQRHVYRLDIPTANIDHILIDKEQRNLYLIGNDGHFSFYEIRNKNRPLLRQHETLVESGQRVSSIEFLNGSISLLVGSSNGIVSQWSVVRDENNFPALKKLRSFTISTSEIAEINSEQRRKGFIAVDVNGVFGIYNTTAEREAIKKPLQITKPSALALSPRANAFLVETSAGKYQFWQVDNEHPEVSFKSLWEKVWYESYPKPDYIWQSSSASNDFEPKYSLTPLVFGTLKAAFYAMMVAIPLALMGAIYTAYFMAPGMRRIVKPSVEIMEALPTVILGFLAGLWLAPFVEEHLGGIFSMLLLMPVSVLIFAYVWQFLPQNIRHKIPEGWDAALLIPVIVLTTWLAFSLSGQIENWFFQGSLRNWLSSELGIGYDQRNALVVGLAMGFAVIPTIFSIAEDAIFSVPRHLTVGSLALGATTWQTMTRVVLLTASPGIFSAVMIGLGRAVGETMIVLMATGNTPVMDLSIFQGMRTLSANIAVEMPESEVNSTHYRILFLAALVLFLFTFIVNTLAELIRQRLREKYSSL